MISDTGSGVGPGEADLLTFQHNVVICEVHACDWCNPVLKKRIIKSKTKLMVFEKKFIIFAWALFVALWGCVWPTGYGLDMCDRLSKGQRGKIRTASSFLAAVLLGSV